MTLGVGLGSVVALIGAFVGAGKLSDNSFFTHLATGRLILDQGSVPSTDPYTFTAAGEVWTVQSWLASLMYAVLERGFGLAGPRLLHMALASVVAVGVWWLTRAARSLIPRLAIAALSVGTGAILWVERPLMIGLVCFVGLWVLADRGPLWPIVPLMWVWVNSHGSFPLGIVLVGTLFVGRLIDRGDVARLSRVAGLTAVGTVFGGVVSPVSVTILTFPVTLLGRADQLQAVTEWRSPDFAGWGARLFLLQLVLAFLAARRVGRWELVVPAATFIGAALLGARNIPIAAIAVAPLLAAAAPNLGRLRSDERSPLAKGLLGVSVAGMLVLLLSLSSGPHLELESYPMAEIARLDDEGVLPHGDERVAYIDRVGNYLEYRYGPIQNVFFDDRFDMYPERVLEGMIDLHQGRRVLEVLDHFDIDIVVWQTDSPVSEQLLTSEAWVADAPLDPIDPERAADDGSTGWSIFRRNE
ncbi:MAG: hypothetical protein JJE52_05910 [Acidimicrobiia bacterium]|nr:hypothetical protein [Acidimicrobiia bacterium]